MNAFSATLVWCAVQVTVLGVLSAAGYLVLRRWSRASAASLLAAGFVAVAALTALSFSPWPRWWTVAELSAPTANVAPESSTVSEASSDRAETAHHAGANRSGPGTAAGAPGDVQASAATVGWWEYVARFVDALGEAQSPATERGASSWRALIGWGIVAAAALLVARLACGLWLVRRCLRGSMVVDEAALAAVLRECRREMGVDKPVHLRVSPQVSTPATVGWRRPAILLPVTWREWSADELRAVLAHELAHVQRGDFATGALAEFVRAVHFYHPLVHWLAGRLRLDQELAADSMAAAFTGGPQSYLASLARLAIREDDRPLGRLVQPFLPGAGTLTRRIDMLRSKRVQPMHHPVRRPTRVLLAVLAVLAAVSVAGVRLPAASNQGGGTAVVVEAESATRPAPQQNQADNPEFDLRYLSPDATPVMLVAVRPAELFELDEVKKLLESAGPLGQEGLASVEQSLGVPLNQVQQILILMFETADFKEAGYVVHTTVPYNREKVLAALVTRPTQAEHLGKGYFKAAAERLHSVYFPDERTFVAAPESQLKAMMTATPDGASKLSLVQALANVDQDADLLAAIDSAVVQGGPGADRNPFVQSFSALWQKTTSFAASAKFGDEPTSKLAIICLDEASTEPVRTAMEAAIGMARASLDAVRLQQPPQVPAGVDQEMMRALLDDTAKALATIQTTQQGDVVLVETDSAFNAPVALALVLPAVQRAREAARRMQCQNNLRQIALAMHLYADLNGTLPPVAVYDENGKPMHSWRVLLLPFLEQKELYDRYDMNEPWDGPNNRKLIAEMPDVYACPGGIHAEGHTDYAVMVGENTAFPPDREKGIRLDEIAAGDGTSVTFLVGEISGNPNLSIPWTKPQDVEFSEISVVPGSPDGFASLHMNGFNITLADGSVKFVSLRVDRAAFRTLFTRNGGETAVRF